jgi:hypothetical protein
LPASGKTTFLAALWYLLSQREIPTALTLGPLPQNRVYLNELSRKWSRFIPFERTPDEVQEISMQLKDGPVDIDLHVPDMSGETWEAVWSTRLCAEHAAKWAQTARGIMLFLHSEKIRYPLDLMNYKAMGEAAGQTQEDANLTTWSPDNAPTQVVLVDILQTLTTSPLGNCGRRLAVILSAWDKAEETGMKPDKYLQVHFPLLYQFLQYSGNFYEVKVFGVSALGGDLESTEDAKRLKAEDMPSKRIGVVDGDHTHHDLTVPIQWLIA